MLHYYDKAILLYSNFHAIFENAPMKTVTQCLYLHNNLFSMICQTSISYPAFSQFLPKTNHIQFVLLLY